MPLTRAKTDGPQITRAMLSIALGMASPYLPSVHANPQGLVVRSGSATLSSVGPVLTVQTGDRAFLDWRSFNVGVNETTRFLQPSATSIAWNRINDLNPSQIFGKVEANGVLVLANQYGFYFGPDSFVRAAGLVVTTAPISPDMAGGGSWQFNRLPPLASIINYGTVKAESGGSLYLIAEKVENHGVLTAPDGNIGLYAGKSVLVSERPDGRGLSAQVSLPAGSVDNQGRLIADAGTIAIHARVVNQGGLLQANTMRNVGGVIELIAEESVTLQPGSVISATGGEAAGTGGEVRIRSANRFTDSVGSLIDVSGGAAGGNGGRVALSAPQMSAIASHIESRSHFGGVGGELVIDPFDILISNSGAGAPGGGTVNPGDSPVAGTLTFRPSAFASFAHITLQALRDITVSSAWNLPDSVDPTSTLLLQAGRNVNLNSSITAGRNWSVALIAGANFTTPDAANPVGAVNPGTGNINFNSSSSLQTQNGDVSLFAGQSVTLNAGFARTVAGGNIDVFAANGDVNTGSGKGGFQFSRTGYRVDAANLGGVSTAAGGNVNLTAGRNVTSYLPSNNPDIGESDGGSGAFGPAPGDVTIRAGGNVSGHYVLANGQGTIRAGGNAGTSQRLLALSLIKGAWDVMSEGDINLQEVRNPNAIYNSQAGAFNHRFDYDSAAAVSLRAANAINLSGNNRPSTSDLTIPSPIYPPNLSLHAGAGGINIANDIILFPSPSGDLNVTTENGGALRGVNAQGNIVKLILSDSEKVRFADSSDFGESDHALTPVHLHDSRPAAMVISGDMANLTLVSPKRAEVTVHGNMLNAGLSVQNLSPADGSRLTVDGDINNRVPFTFYENLGTLPDFSALRRSAPAFGSNPFLYNPLTRRLIFQGRMTFDQLQGLQHLQVPVVNSFGEPVLVDSLGQPVPVDLQGRPLADGVPLLTPARFVDDAVIRSLYDRSQDVPLQSGTGYLVSGPGKLTISARNVDLGDTPGIASRGPADNPTLALLGPAASVRLDVSGNLNMFASRILSQAGGNLDLRIGGTVQLGSPDAAITFKSDPGRGIFSTSRGDLSVIAGGDINIQDSRIASYDGGHITVRSENGNVNAGDGRVDTQTVTQYRFDPVSGVVESVSRVIPGSGILATTFPDSPNTVVGNITVETPRGNISAGAGGVVQVNLSDNPTPGGRVSLTAGSEVGGVVTSRGNINVSGSGVIGVNVSLKATGSISGVAVAQQNIDISSRQNVTITALGGGDVKASAGGGVSGTLIGVGGVSASGAVVDANVMSQNVAAGTTTTGQTGFTQGAAAAGTSQAAAAQSEPAKVAAATKPVPQESGADGDDLKKSAKLKPVLTRTTGRVTVILPGK